MASEEHLKLTSDIHIHTGADLRTHAPEHTRIHITKMEETSRGLRLREVTQLVSAKEAATEV